MPNQIDVRQTEALEAIAQALQFHMHPDPLVPNYRTKTDKILVVAEHPVDEKTGQPSLDWSVLSENPMTGQRKAVKVSAKDFPTLYEPINMEAIPPEPPLTYRNKVTQEVVTAVKEPDGSAIVTHADGRAEEKIPEAPFVQNYEVI